MPHRNRTGQPQWQRRPEARAQEILDAALQAFAKRGFAATTMQEIATGASVSSGTLYLYYSDKEAIFKSLIGESIVPKLVQLVETVASFKGTSLDLVRLTIRGFGHFAQHDPAAVLPRVIMAEAGNFPDLARFYVSEVTERGLGLVETIIRRGIEEGEFRDVDPKHAARLIVVPLMFIGIWRTSFGMLEKNAENFEGYLETHLDFVTRALSVHHTP